MLINLGYSFEEWQRGLKKPFVIDTDKSPHVLISGITGGGKTVLSQLIVKQLVENKKNVYIGDFKSGGDWDNIVVNYGEYTDCNNIIDKFYNLFISSINQKKPFENYLIIDEFSSFALSKSSKDFKSLMDKIGHIAFMGRSFNYHLILISQQFNAKVLDTAIREQFGTKVYMGKRISSESQQMLFPNSEINKNKLLKNHCGYISTLDTELDIIQIPYINKIQNLNKLLIQKGELLRKE